MFVELSPRILTWDEVDPARHPFDSEAAARVVRSLGPAGGYPDAPTYRRVTGPVRLGLGGGPAWPMP